jgi:hypothetical protein
MAWRNRMPELEWTFMRMTQWPFECVKDGHVGGDDQPLLCDLSVACPVILVPLSKYQFSDRGRSCLQRLCLSILMCLRQGPWWLTVCIRERESTSIGSDTGSWSPHSGVSFTFSNSKVANKRWKVFQLKGKTVTGKDKECLPVLFYLKSTISWISFLALVRFSD